MATSPIPQTMPCRKCGTDKPFDIEHFCRKGDRITQPCRECHKALCKEYYERNRERMLEGFRAARAADPEFHRARDAGYYRKHEPAKKARAADYRKRNPEKLREAHRAWEKANPDRKAAYGKARREKHPEAEARRQREWVAKNRSRLNARRREQYRENIAKVTEYHQTWRAANREKLNALARAWRSENKAKCKEAAHRRRIANGSGITFTAADIDRIFAEQAGLCKYCERDIADYYEIEHFIPLARGGGHEPENIVLACMPCNRSKGSKLPSEWRPEIFKD